MDGFRITDTSSYIVLTGKLIRNDDVFFIVLTALSLYTFYCDPNHAFGSRDGPRIYKKHPFGIFEHRRFQNALDEVISAEGCFIGRNQNRAERFKLAKNV